MIPLTLDEIAAIVGGTVRDAAGGRRVTGPAFLDSRAPESGGLFVALAGENTDGHAFAADAVEGGAAAVLGSRATGAPTVVVADVEAGLQELARVVLSRRRERGGEGSHDPLHVVAITGSQGKTSAKDLLAAVLGGSGDTVATHGSFNNELGLPLTVLRADDATRYLVLEMGARGVGHLAALCRIAPPDVSVVLNVGKAHIGEFGSQEQIAVAKGEIVEALPVGGRAVLNADDPRVLAMAERTTAGAITFGRSTNADVRLEEVALDDLGRASFALVHEEMSVPVSLRLVGEHHALNAAAVAATALALGLPLDTVAARLSGVDRLSPWRMEVSERPDGLSVINDAYNANPDSMRSALETLGGIGRRTGRRTVAVLGEMRELGEAGVEEHVRVGTLAHSHDVDLVVVVGAGARPIHETLVQQRGEDGTAIWVDTVEEAARWLGQNVSGPDVVLVKASRAARLERVAAALLQGLPGQEGQGTDSVDVREVGP